MTDAKAILGVSVSATDEEIRAAYLQKVREYPPETSPREFERVRDAWETLRDPRRRARSLLFADDPGAPVVSLLEGRETSRQFTGPGPWMAALKDLSKHG